MEMLGSGGGFGMFYQRLDFPCLIRIVAILVLGVGSRRLQTRFANVQALASYYIFCHAAMGSTDVPSLIPEMTGPHPLPLGQKQQQSSGAV